LGDRHAVPLSRGKVVNALAGADHGLG
jgi:hypothetical protein